MSILELIWDGASKFGTVITFFVALYTILNTRSHYRMVLFDINSELRIAKARQDLIKISELELSKKKLQSFRGQVVSFAILLFRTYLLPGVFNERIKLCGFTYGNRSSRLG